MQGPPIGLGHQEGPNSLKHDARHMSQPPRAISFPYLVFPIENSKAHVPNLSKLVPKERDKRNNINALLLKFILQLSCTQ
jgi:hypothetical protein